MMGVNLDGVFLACQAQARVMLPRKKGSIINIGSISGSIVNQGISRAHYNASKAAVLHLTKSLAMVRRFRFQVPGSRGPGSRGPGVQGPGVRVQGSRGSGSRGRGPGVQVQRSGSRGHGTGSRGQG